MPNESPPLYEFYFRYKWSPTDFEGFQDAMVNVVRDAFGAVFGPSLIDGGAVAPSGSTRAVTVQPYIAINDDGYLNVQNDITLASVTANSSGNPRKDLIVARPKLTNGTMISRPTSPFDSVPLTILQETEVVVIAGTPAGSPAYPSKAAGDVIIAGLAVANGATSFSSGDIDTTVTELISTNTNFSTWVVGKDTHGTAAITGDSGSTRAALVATGGNNKPGVTAVGHGTSAAIVASKGAGATNGIEAATGDIEATTGLVKALSGLKAKLSGNGSDTIDGYRTGTWTPSATILAPSATPTISQNVGRYVRIGRIVHVFGTMRVLIPVGATGSLAITGLPYSIQATSGGLNDDFKVIGRVSVNSGSINANYGNPVMLQLNSGNAFLAANRLDALGDSPTVGTSYVANTTLDFSFAFSYETTASF